MELGVSEGFSLLLMNQEYISLNFSPSEASFIHMHVLTILFTYLMKISLFLSC